METLLPKQSIVLLGLGHTNSHVLRMWRMKPLADTQLVCVSNFPVATYSGMLPGVLAGQYSTDRMSIDLVRLCAASGARLIQGNVTGLDIAQQQLLFDDRPSLPFDILSVGIGSVPSKSGVELLDDTVLAIKPMQTFLERLISRIQSWREKASSKPFKVVVVGAGAGGVEITLCLPARLQSLLEDVPFRLTLVHSSSQILSGSLPGTASRITTILENRGVELRSNTRVKDVTNSQVTLDSNEVLDADLVLWATEASGPAILERLGLPLDERGFLRTQANLLSTSGSPVFAVGDAGTIEGNTSPKAGVYAVRQGPFLWDNLQRYLSGKPLRDYVPQEHFLKLLNTGDGRSVGEYMGLSFEGAWCWWLKNYIDERFMDMYQDYSPMPMTTGPRDESPAMMRCAGCGGKVSGSVLSRVLQRLDIPAHKNVLLGLDQPDDAAIIQTNQGNPVTVTVDFFAAPLDDPYLVGRIAALNSASDVFAVGAKPIAALASANLPVGNPRAQEQVLYELLQGSLEEFRQMGATLVGGHTIEGPRLTIGFTVLADQGSAAARTKGRLRQGDRLVLTKPVGTGVLLAAHMRAACRAEWMQVLLQSMLHSNEAAAQLLDRYDIAAVTDVTGFGLAGHLLEMLRATDVSAVIELESIPLLPGARELFQQGKESTLAPANRATETNIRIPEKKRALPEYSALFDPQTSGGLLLGIPEKYVDEVLQDLGQQSDLETAVVGHVVDNQSDLAGIQIV